MVGLSSHVTETMFQKTRLTTETQYGQNSQYLRQQQDHESRSSSYQGVSGGNFIRPQASGTTQRLRCESDSLWNGILICVGTTDSNVDMCMSHSGIELS